MSSLDRNKWVNAMECKEMVGSPHNLRIFIATISEEKLYTLKTKSRQFDNFVVTGGTVNCHNDNLRCQQRRQCCQIIDFFVFSVYKI